MAKIDIVMERTDNIQKTMKKVEHQLELLNGQVTTNTKAKNQQEIINKLLFAIGGAALGIAVGAAVVLFRAWLS